MHILLVTKLLPLPADSGLKLRSLALLESLSRDAEVTIAAFDDGQSDHGALARLGVNVVSVPWQPTIPSMLRGLARTRSLTSARFWDNGLAGAIASLEKPVDVLVLEFVQLEALVRGLPAHRRILSTQNVESRLSASMAGSSHGLKRWGLALDAYALERIEKQVIPSFDVVAVVSNNDADHLPARARSVIVCPNGQDAASPTVPVTGATAVFVGRLGWAPNEDACTWLARSIWPLVRERRPDARLQLVGRDPSESVNTLASEDGIDVVGAVPSVRPYLDGAVLALAPLRAGSGTRLKILEALNVGRPVVATTIGAEGLEDLVGHGLFIADDEVALAKLITDLLDDPATAAHQGALGRAAVEASYSWDATCSPWSRRCTPNEARFGGGMPERTCTC